ncbi:MAG TPA: hypothetical protein VML55_22425, partial [Planctomycetaceae bacterium]|nr:hypothetical protein [Planctomycetaceae bacterium]
MSSTWFRVALASAALGLLPAGCGRDDSSPPANGPSPAGNGAAERRPSPIDMDPASLQVTDWAGIEQLVARHRGQIVVVYLWATFSQPSVNEFPQLVRLCRTHASDLRCISVSVDYAEDSEEPEALRPQIAKFLGEQGADFEHVISSVPAEQFNQEIELETGIPAVYVYNREGELAKRFDNDDPGQPEFSFRRDVAPFVEGL